MSGNEEASVSPPDERTAKKRRWSPGKVAAVVVAAIVLGAFLTSRDRSHDTVTQTERQVSPVLSPDALVKSVIPEDDADVTTTLFDGTLSIRYSMDPWALTAATAKDNFQYKLSRLVPDVLSEFPEVNKVVLVGLGNFRNIRGKTSQALAMKATFTRPNSETIVWNNIRFSDLPVLADDYWEHPSFK